MWLTFVSLLLVPLAGPPRVRSYVHTHTLSRLKYNHTYMFIIKYSFKYKSFVFRCVPCGGRTNHH